MIVNLAYHNLFFRYKKCGEDTMSENMYLITTVENDTWKHFKSKTKLSGIIFIE